MSAPATPLQIGEVAGLGLAFLAGLLVALVVLAIVAWVVATRLEAGVEALADRMDLGEAVLETPLGVAFESPGEVEAVFGRLARYFVYLAALVIAVGLSGVRALVSPIEEAARYVPSILGAVLIVVVGFVVAGYAGRSIAESDLLEGRALSAVLAQTVQVIIYFVVVTLALDALGYSTAILNTLAEAVAIGVGLGVALAIGIAVGLGSQDYVAEHVEEWVER